jgi:hypothetical protein
MNDMNDMNDDYDGWDESGVGGDDLDRRLRELAGSARGSVASSESDIDSALAAVRSGRTTLHARSSTERPRASRDLVWLGVAASVAALVVGIVAITRIDNDQVSSVPPVTSPSPTTVDPTDTSVHVDLSSVPVPTSSPAAIPTTVEPPTTSAPTSTSTTTTTTTTTTPRTSAPVLQPTAEELGMLLGDVAWEGAGIESDCEGISLGNGANAIACTGLRIDPDGVPVTFDPWNRTLSRYVRDDGEYRVIALPAELDDLDVGLLAVGPDDVAYLMASADGEASDVFAVSVAAADAGRLLETFPAAVPIGDIDVLPTPEGLVASGWYDQGQRPAADSEVLVDWVDRDPTDARNSGERGWFDDAGDAAGVDDRAWSLGERLVDPETWGSSLVTPTFDGGFIAVYTETTGELRGEVMRGWPDGSVEHWLLPGPWTEVGSPILEPMGTLLLPTADGFFVRVAPFEQRTWDWDGSLEIDFETGAVDASALNAFLAGLPADVPPLAPAALANEIAGPLGSPAELRTIEVEPQGDGGTPGTIGAPSRVTVTTERYLDDSVYGSQLTMLLSADLRTVESIEWSQTCQPDRGQQDYRPGYCV